MFYCESWFWQNYAVKLTGHNHNLKSFVGRQHSFWIKRPIFRNNHSPLVFVGPNSIANLEVTEGGMGPTKPTENLSDAPGASPMTFMTAVALSSSAWTRSRRALIRSVTWSQVGDLPVTSGGAHKSLHLEGWNNLSHPWFSVIYRGEITSNIYNK